MSSSVEMSVCVLHAVKLVVNVLFVFSLLEVASHDSQPAVQVSALLALRSLCQQEELRKVSLLARLLVCLAGPLSSLHACFVGLPCWPPVCLSVSCCLSAFLSVLLVVCHAGCLSCWVVACFCDLVAFWLHHYTLPRWGCVLVAVRV